LRSYINNQERELKKLKKKLVDATKRRITLDRKYPRFARQYKEKSKAVEEPLEQEIPELLTVEEEVVATVPLASEEEPIPIPEKGKEEVSSLPHEDKKPE
jgi:phage shock protein A